MFDSLKKKRESRTHLDQSAQACFAIRLSSSSSLPDKLTRPEFLGLLLSGKAVNNLQQKLGIDIIYRYSFKVTVNNTSTKVYLQT